MKNVRDKKTRTMKVYDQRGYKYKSTPTIILKGQWLKEFGFDAGTRVQIQCEEGKLVITKAETIPEMDKTEYRGAEDNCNTAKVAEEGKKKHESKKWYGMYHRDIDYINNRNNCIWSSWR